MSSRLTTRELACGGVVAADERIVFEGRVWWFEVGLRAEGLAANGRVPWRHQARCVAVTRGRNDEHNMS